eukprot:GDKI01006772.1.p1 GENE.GDKI01006772.1~~GDKI01006772.1.p1  ORF type:complete len:202 (-),score=76.74 GDKI01006772.1:408-1013(-)
MSVSPAPLAPFHEKQVLLQCARHTVNNILQRSEFSWSEFERIAGEITKSDGYKHKNFFGLGNYDIGVMMVALGRHGLEAEWFDMRKDVRSELNADDPECVGLLVNTHRPSFIPLPVFDGQHWQAVRKFDSSSGVGGGDGGGVWCNLDSKESEPVLLGGCGELGAWLHSLVEKKRAGKLKDVHVFRVVKSKQQGGGGGKLYE